MDRQLEEFIASDQLERSLFLDLLFQPAVLVPDIYFFISEPLETMLLGSRRTLLEYGIGAGLVIPSFRNPRTNTFTEALKDIQDGGIQGVLEPLERCSAIATRLDLAASRGNNYCPTNWPEDKSVSGRYKNLMERCLTAEEPPWTGGRQIDHEVIRKHWRDSAYWRFDCLEKAIARSDGGLMRGKFMNELATHLGEKGPVPDIRVILSAGEKKFGANSGSYHALRMVCNLMSNCYIYNQATSQQCVASFPKYDRHVRTLLGSIGPTEKSAPTISLESQEEWPTINQELSIPAFQSLVAHDPLELIRIREDVYPDYWASLEEWRRKPTDENGTRVRNTATAYTKAICGEIQGESDTLAVSHRARRRSAVLNSVGGLSATAAFAGELGSVSGLDIPTALKVGATATAALIAVGQAGQTAYSWATAKPPPTEVVAREWKARPDVADAPELNIPSDAT